MTMMRDPREVTSEQRPRLLVPDDDPKPASARVEGRIDPNIANGRMAKAQRLAKAKQEKLLTRHDLCKELGRFIVHSRGWCVSQIPAPPGEPVLARIPIGEASTTFLLAFVTNPTLLKYQVTAQRIGRGEHLICGRFVPVDIIRIDILTPKAEPVP